MASETPLSYERFLELANSAGFDTGSEAEQAHLQDLYTFLKPVLASLKSLENIDVTQDEPDMPFVVRRN